MDRMRRADERSRQRSTERRPQPLQMVRVTAPKASFVVAFRAAPAGAPAPRLRPSLDRDATDCAPHRFRETSARETSARSCP